MVQLVCWYNLCVVELVCCLQLVCWYTCVDLVCVGTTCVLVHLCVDLVCVGTTYVLT